MMSLAGSHHDPRTNKAVELILRHPTKSVPAAMQAAGFSLEESRDRAKQMWIRRRIPSKKDRAAASGVVVSERQHSSSDDVGGVAGGDNEVEDDFECELQDWISCHRNFTIGGEQSSYINKPEIMSKQRTYLEQSVQILHSLADKLLDENMLNIGRSDFITVSNVVVRKSTPIAVLGQETINAGQQLLSADFITACDASTFFHECEEEYIHNKYAAMHAFAQIAYAMCLGGHGPQLPDFNLRNATVSASGFSSALSIRDVSPEGASANEEEDEDEILDMFRKHYRVAESEEIKVGGHVSAMLDVGIPLPMVRFISDLLGDEHGGMFRSDRAFASFDDVLSDLKQMMVNPDRFLHGSSSDRWKIVFDDKLYGRDAATKALMIAADRVTCDREDALDDRYARLTGKKSEVVMVSGHSGAGKSRLVRVGGACLEMGGWLFLRCKFDRVGEFRLPDFDGFAQGNNCDSLWYICHRRNI
jgi:hypothetical protein